MNDNWSNGGEMEKSPNDNRTIGLVILGLGVALAGWVVSIIYQLLTGDGAQKIISNLIPLESMQITIQTSSDIIVAPDSFLYMVGLLFCVLLLAICAGLSKVLMAKGAQMLQPDIHRTLEYLRRDLIGHIKKRQ